MYIHQPSEDAAQNDIHIRTKMSECIIDRNSGREIIGKETEDKILRHREDIYTLLIRTWDTWKSCAKNRLPDTVTYDKRNEA